jgi:hypothetical protein
VSRLLLLVALMTNLAGCAGRNGKAPPPSPGKPVPAVEGVLEYHAFDATGTEVSKGTLTLISSGASRLAGTWQIDPIGDAGEIGPQTGSGTLEGKIEENGFVLVNLNPNNADNNVFLRGTFDGRRFTGDWTFSTFVGARSKGTFEAIRTE